MFSRYDFMSRTEMRQEILKRKLPVNQNKSTLQMRMALLKDDVNHGRNNSLSETAAREILQKYPWKPQELPSGDTTN